MTNVQIIPGNFQITDPAWQRVHLWRRGHVFTSDDFAIDGDPVGRMTNAALGGQPVLWEGSANAWLAADGALHSVDNGSFFVKLPGGDAEVSMTMQTLPVTPNVILVLRRSSVGYHSSIDQIRIQIAPNGSAALQHQVSGNLSTLGHSSVNMSPGDRIGLRGIGETTQVLINGEVVASGTTPVTAAGWAGIGVTGSGTDASVSDFIVAPV